MSALSLVYLRVIPYSNGNVATEKIAVTHRQPTSIHPLRQL